MTSLFVFIMGLLVGSFANVLADRLPNEEDIFWGRSHCDYCKKTLRWFELIPVFSFIVFGGRCLRCHKKLSIQYPIVELISGIGFLALYMWHPSPLFAYISLVTLFICALVIFVSDHKYQIIPDSMLVVSTVAAIVYHYTKGDLFSQAVPLAISALGSGLLFYVLWAVTKGRGMGFGDVKLALVLGLLLGFPLIVFALYIAFLTGAGVGVILILVGKKGWKSKIAFGPFLLLGGVASMIWQTQLLVYWRMFI